MKLLILYFSGVGNTKMVAESIYTQLENACEVSITSIESIHYEFGFHYYDALVIGFPTIHTAPAKPMMDFIEILQPLPRPIPVFLFTTCGLYSANTLRIFAKQCVNKNMIPILNKSYRCAATDGILLASHMDVWFRHERNLDDKIVRDSHDFLKLLNTKYTHSLPRLKLYSILNHPNKKLGEYFPSTIYIHKDHCVACKKCMTACPTGSIIKDDDGYLKFEMETCIHCYRCIHHCPSKALSLSKKRVPSKTLYYR